MGRNHVLAVGDDRVGILHDLQPLEMIVVVQAHAGTDDVEDVDDAERPVALVCAKFAMINMVDSNQGINARGGRNLKLGKLKSALIRPTAG